MTADWLTALTSDSETPVVGILVTIVAVEGSTPREAGAKMLVTASGLSGTIGGGALEHSALRLARDALAATPGKPVAPVLQRLAIAAEAEGVASDGAATLLFEVVGKGDPGEGWIMALSAAYDRGEAAILITTVEQAIQDPVVTKAVVGASGDAIFGDPDHGELDAARSLVDGAGAQPTVQPLKLITMRPDPVLGVGADVTTILERVAPPDFNVVLFGAGHVGKALVAVLAGLPCRITWIDDRAEQFPAAIPVNVRMATGNPLENHVAEAPPGSYFLIMTHSHKLDLMLCRQVLRRDDFRYLGLIGSLRKRRRFEQDLKGGGCGDDDLLRLTCPIGVEGITGKHPAEIAIAVAAELLRVRSADSSAAA